VRKFWIGLASVLIALFVVVTIISFFADEPLRAYIERELNNRVAGYSFRVGKLDLHPIVLSVDLENLTVAQDEHPDPPIAQIPRWTASLQWGDC
jgi:hypothetical protein